MKDFETWYLEIASDQRWVETMQMMHKGKSLRKAAQIVYGDAVSDSATFERVPMAERRRHIHYKLAKMPYDNTAPVLQQEDTQEVKETGPPLTGEERDKALQEWLKVVRESKIVNGAPKMTYKEIADEGDWLPKKPAPYPSCSESEVRKRELHLQYIKENYDPRTADKLPTWIEESEWLKQQENGTC